MGLQCCLVAVALLATCAYAAGEGVKHPVYPSGLSAEEAQAEARDLARFVEMPEAALRALVPKQSGLYFCGCPNCEGGTQENNMVWSPEDPDHVHCRACGKSYPSPDYPEKGEIRVKSPNGEEHRYPYYEDAKGRRYFFEARVEYAKIHYYDGVARRLARVYDITKDERYARAAAVLLDQYARVVPGYVPKFDYPFQPKRFFGAQVKPPYPVSPYRASRYYWWAYGDIPQDLVFAYDLIYNSAALDDAMRARIENDLIRGSVAWVLLNPENLTNMGPLVWESMIEAGRVIGEPDYVHDAVGRAGRMLREQFFYDGFWREGTPSYHLQSVGWLKTALEALRGHSDPAGYISPRDGQHFENVDPDVLFPALPRACASVEAARLPNGRYAPVHDTWARNKGEPLSQSAPQLLPAMGHAVLGGGAGEDQVQVHLAFSGGYGHEHADNLATLFWANGRETFSDLGYTHTKDKMWALCTASHNTVVIDQRNQEAGVGTDGNLALWGEGDLSSVVEVDGRAAYPQASAYRRLLALVNRPHGLPFVVDIFRVAGGETHDWFLHGCADEDQEVRVGVPLQPFPGDLIPAGYTFLRPEHEGDFRLWDDKSPALYGFLRDLEHGATGATWRADFVSRDGNATRLIMVGAPGTEIFRGRDPAIRRAQEDDAKLAACTRPFVMAHRTGSGPSVFAAVLDPAPGKNDCAVAEVQPLLVDEQAVVLRLTSPGAVFLVATSSDPNRTVTCESPEGAVIFRGRYALLRREGHVVSAQLVGTSGISWGGRGFAGPGRLEGRVLQVAPEAFEIEAEVAEGARLANLVAIVTHGDGTAHGHRIIGTESIGPGRMKVIVPATGFAYDPEKRLTRFTSFPLREIAGENRVSIDLTSEQIEEAGR